MYTDFWGLKKPPFDNVPDPTMYVDSHVSVENTIAETLFAIEEGNECLTVIVGDVGLGKTMSLRMILDSLDHEKYKIAFVTNPDMSFVQLLREIIGQLMGKECEIKGKIELLEVFNKLLFETADEGKKILIFIDEANAISPANLESLRLLTNMQDDDRNLFTIVLAGQLEFAKRMEHPSRANLYQRIGTYNKLEKMESEEVVKKYVETRLKLAGGTRKVFTDDAIHWLWEYSEHGVPRLINKIAKLCLKAGETNDFHEINGDVVRQIGERFDKMSGPAVQKRRTAPGSRVQVPKKETAPVIPESERLKKAFAIEEETPSVWSPPPPPAFGKTPEPKITAPPAPPPPPPRLKPEIPKEKPLIKQIEDMKPEEPEVKLDKPIIEKVVPPPPPRLKPEIPKEKPLIKQIEDMKPEEPEVKLDKPIIEKVVPPPPPPPVFQKAPDVQIAEPPPPPRPEIPEEKPIIKHLEEEKSKLETKIKFEEILTEKAEPPTPPTPPPPDEKIFKPVEEKFSEVKTGAGLPEKEPLEAEEDKHLIAIGGYKIRIEIPQHILEQARSATSEQKKKIAGVLAAQTLEKNPQLTATPTADPVSVWSDILNAIINKL